MSDRDDNMASLPWHNPEFRAAERTAFHTDNFLRLCQIADARGHVLTPQQSRLRELLRGTAK